MPKTILIVGATGKVGRNIVPQLAKSGYQVRAATRHPDGYERPQANIEVVHFDYDDRDTYNDALDRVDRLFMMAPDSDERSYERLTSFIDRAALHDVQQIVMMTALGVDQYDGTVLHRVEEQLKQGPIAYTILRPNWFMQNFFPGFIYDMIQERGAAYLPAGDGAVSFIDTRDIADVAAAALTDDHHAVREYDLTGPDSLSFEQALERIGDASGRELPFQHIDGEKMRQDLMADGWSSEEADTLLAFFASVRNGDAARVTDTVEEVTAHSARTFEDYVQEHAVAWQPQA